jgi:hypothetical protein
MECTVATHITLHYKSINYKIIIFMLFNNSINISNVLRSTKFKVLLCGSHFFALHLFIIIDAIIVIVILEVLQSSSIGVYLLFAHTLALAEYL